MMTGDDIRHAYMLANITQGIPAIAHAPPNVVSVRKQEIRRSRDTRLKCDHDILQRDFSGRASACVVVFIRFRRDRGAQYQCHGNHYRHDPVIFSPLFQRHSP